MAFNGRSIAMTRTDRTSRTRHLALAAALAAAIAAAQLMWPAPPASAQGAAAPAQITPELDRLLRQIKQVDTGQLAVSEEDGRFLRVIAATSRARRALEIGSASGYSAIWIGLGLRETGGRLVTIEYDPARAREAADNIRRAGLSDIVQVVQGDGFVQIPKLPGTFDFVFLDAWKKDYKRFLDVVLPRMEAGGVFLAHNVVNKGKEMPDFLDAIEKNPNLLTTIITPSGEGISMSMKRR